jgi:hypothetical protein
MPEKGADAFRDRRGQYVLELAGAALRLRGIEIEQVLKKHLGEPMPPDDPPGALISRPGKPQVVSSHFHVAGRDQLIKEKFRTLLFRAFQKPPFCGTVFFPKRPDQLQDFVMPVLGHLRAPFEKSDLKKFTTFDSGMGKE